MSYIVTKTDGTTLTTIVDGTADTSSTSLTLIGRNYSNYGQLMANNLVWLLENFSNTSSPNDPVTGQIWWQKDQQLLKVYTGSSWKSISSATASITAPATTTAGDIWWDTANQQLHAYNGASPYNSANWILVGPIYSSQNGISGPVWEVIQDNVGSNHQVLSIYLNSVKMLIINSDASFIPQVSIPGFITIQTGLNLRNTDQITGTVSNATNLNNQPASKYFRSDIDNVTTGNIVVLNNNGITLGSAQQLKLNVVSNDSFIKNTAPGGSIRFFASPSDLGSTPQELLTIDGVSGRATVFADPIVNLGIATKQYVDNKFYNTVLNGNPTTSTQSPGDNSIKIATTAFVYAANLAMRSYIDTTLSSGLGGLNSKANIASPIFTGTPQAPTPTSGDSSGNIATTSFVTTVINTLSNNTSNTLALKANIASPIFTGTPQAPTQPVGTADSTLATTSFVVNNSGFKSNVVYQGNSSFSINDNNNNNGSAILNINGTNVLTASESGVNLMQGATGYTQLPGTNNTSLATTAFVHTATQTWGGADKFISTQPPDPNTGNNGDFWFQYQ